MPWCARQAEALRALQARHRARKAARFLTAPRAMSWRAKIASAPTKLAEYLGCGVPCLGNVGVGDMEAILEGEGGLPIGVQLVAAYGREGEPCARCGSLIKREAWANRSSFRCPRCQRTPRG